jgi:hypothetical protein
MVQPARDSADSARMSDSRILKIRDLKARSRDSRSREPGRRTLRCAIFRSVRIVRKLHVRGIVRHSDSPKKMWEKHGAQSVDEDTVLKCTVAISVFI